MKNREIAENFAKRHGVSFNKKTNIKTITAKVNAAIDCQNQKITEYDNAAVELYTNHPEWMERLLAHGVPEAPWGEVDLKKLFAFLTYEAYNAGFEAGKQLTT